MTWSTHLCTCDFTVDESTCMTAHENILWSLGWDCGSWKFGKFTKFDFSGTLSGNYPTDRWTQERAFATFVSAIYINTYLPNIMTVSQYFNIKKEWGVVNGICGSDSQTTIFFNLNSTCNLIKHKLTKRYFMTWKARKFLKSSTYSCTSLPLPLPPPLPYLKVDHASRPKTHIH